MKTLFRYQGFGNCDSRCDVSILPGNIVILSEREDNEGTSVTNMSEQIANQVAQKFLPDVLMESIRWIEHYTHGIEGEETWDAIQYTIKDGKYINPQWTATTKPVGV